MGIQRSLPSIALEIYEMTSAALFGNVITAAFDPTPATRFTCQSFKTKKVRRGVQRLMRCGSRHPALESVVIGICSRAALFGKPGHFTIRTCPIPSPTQLALLQVTTIASRHGEHTTTIGIDTSAQYHPGDAAIQPNRRPPRGSFLAGHRHCGSAGGCSAAEIPIHFRRDILGAADAVWHRSTASSSSPSVVGAQSWQTGFRLLPACSSRRDRSGVISGGSPVHDRVDSPP